MNKKIAKVLYEIAELLEIKGVLYKPKAYKKAGKVLEELDESVLTIYKRNEIKDIKGVGESIALKIEEYIKKGKISYYQELKSETAIRQIVTHFFKTKGLSLDELKKDAKKRKIIYSRFTKPAKQLLDLAGSIEKAKTAIDKVANWANSRKLDYSIETVFKKWLELDKLKPKEVVKKPFYLNKPMVWSESKNKWFVIDKGADWLEFNGKDKDIEWRIKK